MQYRIAKAKREELKMQYLILKATDEERDSNKEKVMQDVSKQNGKTRLLLRRS